VSVPPPKQYIEDLIGLLLWNHPVSESFIATWDRSYKTPFPPKIFWIYVLPQILDKYSQKQQI
jgi:hypothetical protein